MNKNVRAVLAMILGAVVTPLNLQADQTANPELVKSAVSSSGHWLSQIDAGKYDESYAEGCLAFQHKVSKQQWNVVLKALRPSLGPVVSRTVAGCTYMPDGIDGLEGQCMVIRYNTVFAKVPSDLEIVVLKREEGQWRGAGYNAQPQGPAVPDADSPPPATAHTDISVQPVHSVPITK